MTYAHTATIIQYDSVERSMSTAASCAAKGCRTGSEGYTWLKKYSMQLSTRAGGNSPWVRANVAGSERPSKPRSVG